MASLSLEIPDWGVGPSNASTLSSVAAGGGDWSSMEAPVQSSASRKRANKKKNRREAGAAREAAGIPKRVKEDRERKIDTHNKTDAKVKGASNKEKNEKQPKNGKVKKVAETPSQKDNSTVQAKVQPKELTGYIPNVPIKGLVNESHATQSKRAKPVRTQSQEMKRSDTESVDESNIAHNTIVPVVIKSKKMNPVKTKADVKNETSEPSTDTKRNAQLKVAPKAGESTNNAKRETATTALKRTAGATSESEAKSAKRRKLQSMLQGATAASHMTASSETDAIGPKKKMSKLDKARAKLDGAKFRWLNEQLYTMHSDKAVEMMKDSPDLYELYHKGFRNQVKTWPSNPVNVLIKYIRTLPTNSVIGDFGCGDAALAAAVSRKYKVHSFDLVAANDSVTACDIAHVPLKAKTLDVAVYSLALMGTNYRDFLREAHRCLKVEGILKIAEVTSRIEDIDEFIHVLEEEFGFDLVNKDVRNTHFLLFTFKKKRNMSKSYQEDDHVEVLRPCIYKRR
ncbi:hypothetical protein SARC_02844 [Sphaeroforma arctica JP610]|uniref:Ribosomal RNA-processing protein 8 n=1 Tax=Sphaeroforma arctica JP610 TaxID=667725 RepID=A0A0L0G9L1_9EUKA|nr:hypothetical protein SARC_02844 [Sphaeroforma arctica JP610]KNC84953.1 hypothetical protein SARC_02844 [Sphaeroforma arctica JP610]|eukprot:XP_014158855.1 hypothetical protein SARC_02844 [Sphaeroforma arctica JP610]